MDFDELTRDQIIELKQHMLCERDDENGGSGVSYGELLLADELISDDEVLAEYGHVVFTEDDFFCSAGTGDCA